MSSSLPVPVPRSLQHLNLNQPQPQLIETFSVEGLTSLQLNMPVPGMLHIYFDAETEGSLRAQGESVLLPTRVAREKDVLYIEGNDMGRLFRPHGKQDLSRMQMELHLPADINLNLGFIAGAVVLNGGSGDLRIRGKFGEVTGISYSSNAEIDLRAGEVALNELGGRADIEVMLGSVKLGWTEFCGAERVRVHCAIGGVELLLPASAGKQKDRGGLFVNRKIVTPEGAIIHTTIGMGGMEAKDWTKRRQKAQQIADALTKWMKDS